MTVHVLPSAYDVFTSRVIVSFSIAGSVGDAGIRGKYAILLATLYGRSLAQKAEKLGKPTSCSTILPSRHTSNMSSAVLSDEVSKTLNIHNATK